MRGRTKTAAQTAQMRDVRAEWEARRGTFGRDLEIERSWTRRAVWTVLGLVALALGVIGAIVPVLPTTPLMIAAAGCFARSSPGFYRLIMENRVFGPLVYSWRATGSIPLVAKTAATILIIATLGTSIVLIMTWWYLKLLLAVIGSLVLLWIWTRPSEVPISELPMSRS